VNAPQIRPAPNPDAVLVALARRYLADNDRYMSWINDPESHSETHRQPGAGLFREVEEAERRAADAFARAAGIKSRSWRVLRSAAVAALASSPTEAGR
jgi:hypothetical protein